MSVSWISYKCKQVKGVMELLNHLAVVRSNLNFMTLCIIFITTTSLRKNQLRSTGPFHRSCFGIHLQFKHLNMNVFEDDFLVIAFRLTRHQLGHPWEGIHSGFNYHFSRKDHWLTVENLHNTRGLRNSPWHTIIGNAIQTSTRVSATQAETIRQVMDEFQPEEMVHTESGHDCRMSSYGRAWEHWQ